MIWPAAGDFIELDPNFFYLGIVGACGLIFSSSFLMKCVLCVEAIDKQIRNLHATHIKALTMNGLPRR